MNILRYSLKEAHEWANFSGDYNPIHFDLSWVQARGGEKLSVHGMRALLDLKKFADTQISAILQPQDHYIKCAIRIRNPLWNDVDYQVVEGNRIGASAILMEDKQRCLTCNLSSIENYNDFHKHEIEKITLEDLFEQQKLFSSIFKEMPLWVFFDAVIFQCLINSNLLLKQDNVVEYLSDSASLRDIFNQCSVIQTHQELIFDEFFMHSEKFNVIDSPLNIYIQPSIVTGDLNNGLLILINGVAEYKNKIMSNSFTLKIN